MKWFLCFLFLVTQLAAEIVETTHFKQLVPHVDKGTLVILDIDDTLLLPVQTLGCDAWFIHRLKQHQTAGLSSQQALERALSEWEAIRHITKMEIVEPGSDALVRSLQDEKYSIMGLTTQGLALATRTSQQLKACGFDLTRTAPSSEDHYLLLNNHGVLFRNGVLFTSGQAKGEALFLLCEKIGYSPKRIVFVNDKESHIKDIEESAKKRGVEFVGLRYGFADDRRKGFDSTLADFQFTHSTFAHILTDAEAKEMLKTNSQTNDSIP